jgi:hypothetical protein
MRGARHPPALLGGAWPGPITHPDAHSFIVSNDPVRLGLVASIALPDNNLIWINSFSLETWHQND